MQLARARSRPKSARVCTIRLSVGSRTRPSTTFRPAQLPCWSIAQLWRLAIGQGLVYARSSFGYCRAPGVREFNLNLGEVDDGRQYRRDIAFAPRLLLIRSVGWVCVCSFNINIFLGRTNFVGFLRSQKTARTKKPLHLEKIRQSRNICNAVGMGQGKKTPHRGLNLRADTSGSEVRTSWHVRRDTWSTFSDTVGV